jgi:translocation and assembly module TamB
LKALWRFLLLLLLLLPLLLPVALFTESGSRALLALVDRYSPLDLEYAGGSVMGTLEINRLAFETQSVSLEVSGINARLTPACFWRSAFCFTHLQAASLEINLPPSTGGDEPAVPGPPPATADDLMVFPFALETDALDIASTRIRWHGGEWRQEAARLRLRISQSKIHILEAVFASPVLLLRDTDPEAAEDTARIELGRINLPFELSVDDLLLDEPSWDFYGGTHQLQQLSLRGYWRNTELHLDRLEGQDIEWGALSLSGSIAFEEDWPLQLSSDISLAKPPLWEGLHSSEFAVAAQGSLAELALQLDSRAPFELAAQVQADVLDRALPFASSLRIAWPGGLRLGDIDGTPAALADVIVDKPFTASLRGTLLAQQFDVQGQASGLGYQSLELTATGAHEQGVLSVQHFLLQDAPGGSELRGSGELITGEPLQASLALASEGFQLPELSDQAFGTLRGGLNLHATMQGEQWQLALNEVDVSGSVNDLPARLEGYAGLESGMRLGRSELHAELNGAQLLVRSSGAQGQPGQFELSVPDIGRWQPDSQGEIQIEGLFEENRQAVRLSGELADLRWNGLEVDRGSISAQYSAQGKEAFELELALHELAVADMALSFAQLRVFGSPDAHSVELHSQGDLQGTLSLAGSLKGTQWTGQLAATELGTPAGPWRLSRPVALAWSGDKRTLSVAAHCWWQQERTSICPGALDLGPQGKGSLKISGDMGPLEALMPPGVEVQGDMQLQLQGARTTADGLTVAGDLQTRSLLLTRHHGEGESVTLGWDGGNTIINYGRDGLSLEWEVQRGGRRVLAFDVFLPPERNAALKGGATVADLQLSTLAPFVPALSKLEGTISGQLRLSGTVDQPLAHGELKLASGQLALVGNSTELADLNLTLDFQGDRARVNGAGLLGGGALQLDGELNRQPQWHLALSVSGEKHWILYPPSTQLLISESLQITAGPGLLDIVGELEVIEGVIEPDELPAGSVAISSDVVEVDYAGNEVREDLPFELTMDVQIHVRDHLLVTGSLIDANLGGDLRALQEARRPLQLFGTLNVIDGELRAYQQRLQIKRGALTFSGRPENPAIQLRAQREISGSNVVVGMQVQGSVDEMILDVYSEPAMSEAEAMSYLVRGRGMDASAGAEGTALALSMAGGVVNQSTIVTELNRVPGISNVAFGAEGSEEDTAASVSGYIGNRIYLSYGVGLYEPINVLTARLFLQPRLWLEVVSRLENSVDLYYSFDID